MFMRSRMALESLRAIKALGLRPPSLLTNQALWM